MKRARRVQPRVTSGQSGAPALVPATLSLLAALTTAACSDDPNVAETVPDGTASEAVPEAVAATETVSATSLPLCSELVKDSESESEAPASLGLPACLGSTAGCDYRIRSGVVSLDARASDDAWAVTVLSGDLVLPALWRHDGALAELAPGDRIAVSSAQTCIPYSGCKSFVVVRDADDDRLIYAHFDDAPDNLVTFGWLTGLYIVAEPSCHRDSRRCSEDETQTWYRLTVARRGSAVVLDPYHHAPWTVDEHPYTAWLGGAFETTAAGPWIPGACTDAGDFFRRGA